MNWVFGATDGNIMYQLVAAFDICEGLAEYMNYCFGVHMLMIIRLVHACHGAIIASTYG